MRYLYKTDDGQVICHESEALGKKEFGRAPDMVVSDEDWRECGECAYVDDSGAVIAGLSPGEATEQARLMRIAECRRTLSDTDYIACKLSEAAGDAEAYAALRERYAETLSLRQECREYLDKNS